MLCAPLSGAPSVWAAGESKPASPGASPAQAATAALVWPSFEAAVPALLAASAAQKPGLVAPAYGGWLNDPHQAAPGIERFVSPPTLAQAKTATPTDEPPAFTAAVPTSVPLPPIRLKERVVVVAIEVPLPPRRLAELVPGPQIAALEFASPDISPIPDPLESAAPPVEDAARPIDDAPEAPAYRLTAERAPPQIEELIERYAERFDVPAHLVRRVAWRESKFNPKSRNGPYWGLMQIRADTARALGFRGEPRDLLDANTNLAFAAAYLANAYRVAGRNEKRAVMLYSRGYYYEAKRKGMLGQLIRTASAVQD